MGPTIVSTISLIRLFRPILALTIGLVLIMAVFLPFSGRTNRVQAAPSHRPLAVILTDTTSITHTNSTTHEMRVFGDGRLTDRFLNEDGSNQIDIDGADPEATTIAILFDQHISTTNLVDVGMLDHFSPTTVISLDTNSTIQPYSEDTYAIYASNVLSYQVTQRTLATDTTNCVIVNFGIRNTGSTDLTGGIFLYRVDVDVAQFSTGDLGFYDPSRRFIYSTDQPGSTGYGMGFGLVQGELRGYGINGNSYVVTENQIKNEMVNPVNSITNGSNNVLWLVANIPDLSPAQETDLSFSLCAQIAGTEEEVGEDLIDTITTLVDLSLSKSATPAAGTSVPITSPISYSIVLTGSGNLPINNVVITDTIPAFTNLISYSINQGSIAAGSGLITATVNQLIPASDTITITLVVSPSIFATNGTIISNQAFVSSDPVVTMSNVITHEITNLPTLSVNKLAAPHPTVEAGQLLFYTIVVTNGGSGFATDVTISDTLPLNTEFVPGSVVIDPPGGSTGITPYHCQRADGYAKLNNIRNLCCYRRPRGGWDLDR